MGKNYASWPVNWPKSIDYPELPVFSFLEQTAKRVPNRLAIIFGGMELTYQELNELADRFAAALLDLGVNTGDRVAIHLPNCPQFAIAYYGILKTGATFTPLSPLLSAREALHQLNDSGAKILISFDLMYPLIEHVIPETVVSHVITTSIADCFNPLIAPLKPIGKTDVPGTLDMAELLGRYEPIQHRLTIDVHNDIAHLAYTGGTTGLSKGVMLTHHNVVANVLQFTNWFVGANVGIEDGLMVSIFPPGVDPEKDRVMVKDKETSIVVAPWFHAMGTIGYLNSPVVSGMTMVVQPRFEVRDYLDAIVKYNVTQMGGAPQLFIPLMNLPDIETYDLSGVKLIASGAAPLSQSLLDKMEKVFSGVILEAYGLTECSMGATANPPDKEKTCQGSVGLPVFDTECKVVSIETGEDLDPGEEGELCIRGPQVMKGYWQRPDETRKVLKDGWLYTGDIAKEDENGFFYITDRKKDMIIYKGYNVYPRELEEILLTHPSVLQCAVLGKQNADAGEIPVAFVQVQESQTVSGEELADYVNRQIAFYKKVREIVIIDEIPVSAAGKILKRQLRSGLEQSATESG